MPMLSLSTWHRIAAALSGVFGVILAMAPALGLDSAKVAAAQGDIQTIVGALVALVSVLGALWGEVHQNVQAMKNGTPPPQAKPVAPSSGSAT
ncbi:MAG: hypothetical protein KGH75_00655 [Rhodospirillales bacterium]|nr:hypothetical protein [Rhodospirillales bacterium]